jgi:uncharacterized membrane protein
MAKFCGACGKEVEPGIKFCGSCGAAVESEADSAQGATADPGATAGFGAAADYNAAGGSGDVSGAGAGAGAPGAVTAQPPPQAPAPGAPGASGQQQSPQAIDNIIKMAQNTADYSEEMDKADVEKNKFICCAAYLLFFLPLVMAQESKFGRFHANQGLLCLILYIAGTVVTTIVRMILRWGILSMLSSLISFVVFIAVFGIGVIGIINAYSGKAKDIPFIGTVRLIK